MQENFTKKEKWFFIFKMIYFYFLNNTHHVYLIGEDDEMDSSQLWTKESHSLLPSFQCAEKPKNILSQLNRLFVEKEKIINKELFKRYFRFQGLIDMEKELYKTKNIDKNKGFVNVIKNWLADLENRIEEMSKMKLKMNGYMIEWILQIFFMLMIGTKKKKD